MAGGKIIRRSRLYPITQFGNPALWHYTVAGRNALRSLIRRRQRRIGKRRASIQLTGTLKKKLLQYNLPKKKKHYQQIKGNAAGTTKSTTTMIVRRTPRQQRFMRKMFKNASSKVTYVQRFGFSWIGASENNKTIWYSVCHNKFNNIYEYLKRRINPINTYSYNEPTTSTNEYNIGLNPSNFIYIGKCTFSYELYNPTNYNITVYIYDLICKHDTPYDIKYGAQTTANSSPECCMFYGSEEHQASTSVPSDKWFLGDPTYEVSNGSGSHNDPVWDTVGMKPTDYMGFNVLWKVKAIKKLILPPQTSHHHNVVFNPKKKVTLGNLLYPRLNYPDEDKKNGVAGLTQATLFGFEGQVAINGDESADNEDVGTLPGKIVVKCIRKVHVHNFYINSETIFAKNNLKKLTKPYVFSNLIEKDPETI